MANMAIPDDILDDVYRSNASGVRAYLDRYGEYELLIEAAFYKQIKDVGRVLPTKLQVISSKPITVRLDPTLQNPEGREVTEDPHPPGYRCSYTVNWDGDAGKSAAGNMKALMLAINGMSETKLDETVFKQTLKDYVSDAQPARGFMIKAVVMPKGAGWSKDRKMFDHYIKLPDWQCLGVPGQGQNTAELVAKRRAEIEQYIVADLKKEEEQMEAARQNASGGGNSRAIPPPLPGGAPPINADPLAGWTLHPQNPPEAAADPYYWKPGTNEMKRRSELLAARK